MASKAVGFESLNGLVLTSIEVSDSGKEDKIEFHSACGRRFIMHHEQDCCEDVTIEDICGDIHDLIGSPILMAEESTNSGQLSDQYESFTWTFYKLATIKGAVTIRWYGISNSFYSEAVDFEEITND